MTRRTRLVGYYGLALLGALVAFALAYDYGMSAFEGRPRSLLRSLGVVVQTFTTTGYGGDAPWASPIMNLLLVGMQASSLVLLFAAFPVLVVPLLEDALESAPPTTAEGRNDHVLVCEHTPRGRALIAELESRGVEYAIVEPDRETATDLHEAGYAVVHGDPESTATLEDAGIADASAVIADATDEANASIVLTAREAAEDVRVLSIADDPALAEYHRYAGADAVFSPRQLLGESLADRATTTVSAELGDVIDMDEAFDIAAVPVRADSELAGRTLEESRIGERTNTSLIGAWIDGEFVRSLSGETTLDERTRLLALGRGPQLRQLEELARSPARRSEREHVVVAGVGEVGSAVGEALTAAGVPWTGIDVEERPGVDVTCDATDPEALRAAGIEDARTVVLALGDDTEAMFATLIVRELAPEVAVVARANDPENVRKLYRAGADAVLALGDVSGRMVAAELLGDDALRPDTDGLEVTHLAAPELAGQTLAEAAVRTQTGVTVIAAERDGELHTGITPSFSVREGDTLVIAGTEEDLGRFEREFR